MTYLIVYKCSKGKEVKEVGEEAPDIGVAVFSKAFIVKAINLSDLSWFVIAAKNGQPVTITEFQCDELCYGLHRVVSSVDIVAHEEIVCVWWISADSKQLR